MGYGSWRPSGRLAWCAGVGLLLVTTAVTCGPREQAGPAAFAIVEPASAARNDRGHVDAVARPSIVILGDSLTAGLGLPVEQAFPSRLQEIIDAEGYEFDVVNAGVSGDTTAAGFRRLEWTLDGAVRVLILALGANDGLRGLPVPEMQRNLEEIIRQARARQIEVLLTGMEAPPNLGSSYTVEFREAYRELAERQNVAFLPFLLNGIAGHPELNQADGMHPNAEGARMMADLVWPVLRPMLDTSPIP